MPDQPLPPLQDLGRRILILGPTNAGKSRLAVALARKLQVPAIHLDQFRHHPGTDWQPREDAEFNALHDASIEEDGWVMDGNYTMLISKRLARGTGIIVIDDHVSRRLWRYLRRTTIERDRAGGLNGGRDSVKWQMVVWLWTSRRNGERYRQLASESGLPFVHRRSLREVKALYAAWNL